MNTQKLFHKDFTIMVLGQIISLFGNSILRFTLSLYILDTTGSAAVFGSILAVSMIPTVLLSPFGGVLADRVNRRNIMVVLDYCTSFIIFLFALLFFNSSSPVIAVGLVMVLLSVIQACYQPSVQSSIPVLVSQDNLMKANGIVIQVNALSNLLGPILAGILYSFVPLRLNLIISCICFFFSATMELFLHIPFFPQEKTGGLVSMVKKDLGEAFHFLRRERPDMMRVLVVIACINLFLSAMIIVGLPVIIKIYLGLSTQHYSFADAAVALGTILGSCLTSIFPEKIHFKTSYRFLLGSSIALLPMGLAVVTNRSPGLSYGILMVFLILALSSAAVFNVAAQTYAQQQTPIQYLGKVGSFITVICVCALPLGQAMYGGLFQLFQNSVSIVIFFACLISIFISLYTKKTLKALRE
ncbi:MFS transporter [Lactonifactor longoviformis]|uniref:MFS transporter n=1 Tax=Lactonifactor TaxID=420345 RepID=UPI0012B09FFC|nr:MULTISPECIES: MFS transporter [Lactonifactor]MCB5712519.1 MFS transporter [Lactonifactor longoviformis]MCB5716562.1 MFS transporter [Lactonifactor longoviformis]MCQ4670376.1 MFS transporter [Lactonifactor longoviformis]MSA00177.1 MFS transporter [Lactonifactor sp. BIOML-A5]MSA06804.1 MFS transporter [Lactonifactor sp. BIOML-A4]